MKDDDIEELKEELSRVKQRERALQKKAKKGAKPALLIKDTQDEEEEVDGEVF